MELLIENTYTVTGHPTIVSGLLKSGKIKLNDNLIIGIIVIIFVITIIIIAIIIIVILW